MGQENSSPYDLVIADLEGKRDQITAAIEMLKALRATGALSAPLPVPSQRQPITAAEIPRDAFFGMTLPEAAKKYLSIERVTKPNPELCSALINGGFKTQSNNFSEVVRSTLQRHADFVKVNGEWGLAEWYGNRASRRIRRPTLAEHILAQNEEPSETNSDGSS